MWATVVDVDGQTSWVFLDDPETQAELRDRFLADIESVEASPNRDDAEVVWVPHDVDTAFQWSRPLNGHRAGQWEISGLVFYGDRLAERLRQIHFTGSNAPRFSVARLPLVRESVPTHSELQSMREVLELVAAAERIEEWGPWTPRGEDESFDDFLVRVADTFRVLERTRPHSTRALAELADVPYTTAVNWVRKARDKGLLPRSRRQLAKGQNDG